MNARRRYDTTALIQDLKADRRKGIGLSLAAIVVVIVLVGVYLSQIGGGAPVVPGSADPVPATDEQRAKAIDEAIADDPQPEPDEAQAKPETVAVEIVLPRKTSLLIDGASVGKVKTHQAELEIGPHTFEMKLGKRTIEHREELKAGTSVQVTFRKKRAVSTVTPIPEADSDSDTGQPTEADAEAEPAEE